ncbi:MAG: division/cell wall cluster transcriptional repressor MraZ [Oscillospiraceae bacterium]
MYEKGADDLPTTMLKGTYYQSMDVKGRMTFPAKLREIIGEKFVVTKGLDGCLFVYSLEDFEERAEKIAQLPLGKGRNIQRNFMANAVEVEADKQGRILVPQTLRDMAALVKDVVVVGVSGRCEIWDKERWDELNNSIDDEEVLAAMEGLDF